MTRKSPYKSKSKRTVVGLAFHRTEMALVDKQVSDLYERIGALNREAVTLYESHESLEQDLKTANANAETWEKRCRRERLVNNKLVGWEG